jgi:hypothetical protein
MLGKNMQKVLFKDYVEPLLSSNEKLHSYDALLELASRAFSYDIQTRDIQKAQLYQAICNEISTKAESKDITGDVFSLIIRNQEHNAPLKVNRIISRKNDGNDDEEMLRMIEEYKVLFEVFLRDFLTPIYIFIVPYLKKSVPQRTAQEFVNVGTDKMLQKIEEAEGLPNDDIKTLIENIDPRIRHSIAHERWRILDDDKIELQPINSGQEEKVVLTKNELEKLLDEFQKTLWSLRAGFFTYLENINFHVTDAYHSGYTKKEVEALCISYDEKVIEVTNFEWGKEVLKIEIKNKKQEHNPAGEILTNNGCYDIIACIEKVSFADRCTGFLSGLLKYLNHGDRKEIKTIVAKLTCNEEFVGEFNYDKDRLNKINEAIRADKKEARKLIEELYKDININKELTIEVRSEQIVPAGTKKMYIQALKDEVGGDVIFL